MDDDLEAYSVDAVYSVPERPKHSSGSDSKSTAAVHSSSEEQALNSYIRAQLAEKQFDWNERWQQLLQRTALDRDRVAQLQALAAEFAAAATRLCCRIVDELFVESKTVPAITSAVGGVAGGAKYLAQGIFVKLASKDFRGVYGGDELAKKSASCELLSLSAYLDLRIRGLHFPLMALVLYRGHALVCQSVVPIDCTEHTSLQHGSSDAGKTIRNESPALESLLRRAAQELHLAPHTVAARNKSYSRMLYAAADLEAHYARDGRYYLIDTARALPPTAPRKGDARRCLSARFRPEALRAWKGEPLSPDAFSSFFPATEEEMRTHNENVIRCTKWLEEEVIASFAKVLDARRVGEEAGAAADISVDVEDEGAALVSDMHLRGINVRYLVLLYSHVREDSPMRSVILLEALARVLKQNVNELWRAVHSDSQIDFARTYCERMAELRKESFWKDAAPALISAYFVRGKFRAEDVFNLYCENPDRCVSRVRARVARLVGVDTDGDDPSRITIVPRVKHLSRVSFEQALSLLKLAEACESEAEKRELLEGSIRLFRVLKNDRRAMFNHAVALSRLAKVVAGGPNEKLLVFRQCFDLCASLSEHEASRVSLDRSSGSENLDGDYRISCLLGTSLLDAFKCTGKEEFVRNSVRHLEQSVSLCSGQAFEPLYNLGCARLALVRHLVNLHDVSTTTSSGAAGKIIEDLLNRSVEAFEQALEVDPGAVGCFINIAVAKSKLARLTPPGFQRDRLYDAAFKHYEKAASRMSSSFQLYFDWGNALYRFGKDKVPVDESMAVSLLQRALDCYAKSLSLRQSHEAWLNLGVTLEKLFALVKADTGLLPYAKVFLSLESMDTSRASDFRRRAYRAGFHELGGSASSSSPLTSTASMSPRSPLTSSDEGSEQPRRRAPSFFSRRSPLDEMPVVLYSSRSGLTDTEFEESLKVEGADSEQCTLFGERKTRMRGVVVPLLLKSIRSFAQACKCPYIMAPEYIYRQRTDGKLRMIGKESTGGFLQLAFRIRGYRVDTVAFYIAMLVLAAEWVIQWQKQQPQDVQIFRAKFDKSCLRLTPDGLLLLDCLRSGDESGMEGADFEAKMVSAVHAMVSDVFTGPEVPKLVGQFMQESRVALWRKCALFSSISWQQMEAGNVKNDPRLIVTAVDNLGRNSNSNNNTNTYETAANATLAMGRAGDTFIAPQRQVAEKGDTLL